VKHFYLAIGFVMGACATVLHSDVKEYTINATLPTAVFLQAEGTDVRKNVPISDADGYKCFTDASNRAVKRYIVDVEQQLIECQAKCAK